MKRARASVLTALLAVACSKPSPPAAQARDASAATDASTTEPDASPKASGVREGDVRALLDAWLAAQNGGDFTAYEKLYASRFEGVRRSGTQTARLDRARWMKERRRMFEQKTTVAAVDIVVTTSGESADVRFVQSWSQASYRDEGPKHMVLVREKSQLRVAREEMLASTVIAPEVISLERFAFAVDAGGPHLVLSAAPQASWIGADAPTLVAKKEPWTTRRPTAKLPAELAAWTGRRVELFGDHGGVCEGTIGGLSILGRVVPHFGRVAEWMGTGDFAGQPKASDAQIARDAWELSTNPGAAGVNGHLLVAEVKPETGDCKGALWGRPVAPQKPVIVAAKSSDAATKALALAAMRASKAYGETQTRYEAEKDAGDPKRWEDFDAHVHAQTFAHPSGTTIVTLTITSGSGCGTFGATLAGAWELQGNKLAAVREPESESLLPAAAADVDGDGSLDLVFPEKLLRKREGVYRTWNKLDIPFLDCGC